MTVMAACFGEFLSDSKAQTNLVTNGGFEIGNVQATGLPGQYTMATPPGPTGWTLSAGGSMSGIVADNFTDSNGAHSGNIDIAFTATLLDYQTAVRSISQTITTTPGTQYTLQFWVANPQGGSDNLFQVNWGGTLLSLTGANLNSGVVTGGSGWTLISTTVTATSTSTSLVFSGYNQSAGTLLDDVSVVAVPEPMAASSLVAGVLGLTIRRRRPRAAA